MRVLIEVVHIAIGLIAATLISAAAAWSYPRATDDIWLVGYACMIAVIAMGVGPVRKAFAEDRARLAGGTEPRADG
ncbi:MULTISPECIES: hypothetical protein [Bacteria]|jgi:uncharacterized membrane protein|uniref:Membrane protein n=1 Tax=Staphylococcus aureus TaxID=1280 RepID=A0AA40MKN3_STAAU|nr:MULTISPECIES: hypothetical protein [Bacteria]KIU01365.1 membrane protein [Staphylococcus aureus]